VRSPLRTPNEYQIVILKTYNVIDNAWEGILQDAGLGEDVVRHSLRHTAATWLMQAGVDMWEAAGWLGMTVEQLEANYGHHHPEFQEEAAEAFGGRR